MIIIAVKTSVVTIMIIQDEFNSFFLFSKHAATR